MKIEKSVLKTIKISDVPRLDPITAIIDGDNGKLTLEVYGKAWTAYWGSAKHTSVESFFCSCDNDYLINCLDRGISSDEIDFDEIPNYYKRLILKGRHAWDFDDVEARRMWDKVDNASFENLHEVECFSLGDIDFDYYNLPRQTNHNWAYLDRIVSAVKEAFQYELDEKIPA